MTAQSVDRPEQPHFDSVEEAIAYYAHLPVSATEAQRDRLIKLLLA